MAPYLLVDFGTTSTKSALVDLDTGAFAQVRRYAAIPNIAAPHGHFEIPLEALRRRFLEICADGQAQAPLRGILLCSEMHGFALLDRQGRPLSNYISWKDERSREEVQGRDTFSLVAGQLGPAFKQLTGMRPRPGFPLMNLAHLGRAIALPAAARLVSLPCWLARCTGEAADLIHPTILAGMALFDLRRAAVSAELLALLRDLTGCAFSLGEPAPAHQVAGYWRQGGARVPIYAGVGDHQCAVLGAANLPRQSLSLNLGTGSQASVIGGDGPGSELELRPYFDEHLLQTITHIPAGRALAAHLDFLAQVRGAPDSREFWAMLAALGETGLQQATLRFGLSLFKSARGYREGGSIAGIEEGAYTLENYLASLLASFLDQYLEVRDLLDPHHRLDRAILSGGLARNLPRLHQLFARRAGCQALPATSLDETLLGLRTLALVADGRASTALEAQGIFGRNC
jgi:sugar (pentulose or hexulose) kinase